MTKEDSAVSGRYRIVEMPDFDPEYVDEETEAFIRFDHGRRGEFHFGYVHGFIDYRAAEREGKPAVEWSWDGNDEHHPAMGRGWAVLEEDGQLSGVIFFHQGDEWAFRAKKWPGGKPRKPKGMFVIKDGKAKRIR